MEKRCSSRHEQRKKKGKRKYYVLQQLRFIDKREKSKRDVDKAKTKQKKRGTYANIKESSSLSD